MLHEQAEESLKRSYAGTERWPGPRLVPVTAASNRADDEGKTGTGPTVDHDDQQRNDHRFKPQPELLFDGLEKRNRAGKRSVRTLSCPAAYT